MLAAKTGDKAKIVHETADLWFHTLVLLAQLGAESRMIFCLSSIGASACRAWTKKAARTGKR